MIQQSSSRSRLDGGAWLIAAALLAAFGCGVFYSGMTDLPWLAWSCLALAPGASVALARLLRDASTARRYAPFIVAILVYFAWLTVATLASVSPEISLAGFWILGAPPLAMLMAFALLEVWPVGYVLVWLMPLALGAVAWGAGALWAFESTAPLVHAPVIDPNNIATLGFAVLLPCFAWGCGAGGARRMLGLAGLPIAATVAVVAGSRATLALGLGASLVLAALAMRSRRSGVALAVAVLTTVMVVVIARLADAQTAGVSRSAAGLLSTAGFEYRFPQWRAALEIFADHPLTGSGPSTFMVLYPRYRLLADQWSAGAFPHNDYLQLLAEGGVPLLAALLTLGGACAWRWGWQAWRIVRRADTHPDWLGFGALAAVGFLLAEAAVNFTFYIPGIGLLAGVLVAVGFFRRQPSERRDRMGLFAGRRLLTGTAAVLLSFGVYLVLVDAVTLGYLGGRSGVPASGWVRADAARQFTAARWLHRLNPTRHAPLHAQAKLIDEMAAGDSPASQRRAVRLATPFFKRAIALGPLNTHLYLDFAAMLKRAAGPGTNGQRIESLLREALRLDPQSPRALISLVNFLEAKDRHASVKRVLQDRFLPWCGYIARIQPAGAGYLLNRMGVVTDGLRGDASARQTIADCRAVVTHVRPRTKRQLTLRGVSSARAERLIGTSRAVPVGFAR